MKCTQADADKEKMSDVLHRTAYCWPMGNGTTYLGLLLGLWIMAPVAQATNNCCIYRDGVRVCANGHTEASCEALENGKFFPDRTCEPLFGLCAPKSGPVIGEPCSDCGPEPDWVDDCTAGVDAINRHSAVVGVDLTGNCEADSILLLSECEDLLVITRSDPVDGVIDTEIIDLCLTGGGVTLRAGAGTGSGPNGELLNPSLGLIDKSTTTPALADSNFEVFFEIEMEGTQFLYNQVPLLVEAVINCVPPAASYINPDPGLCMPLFDQPEGGIFVANLVSVAHITFPKACCLPDDSCVNLDREQCLALDGRFHSVDCEKLDEKGGCDPPIPATSEWGLAVLALVVLIAGTVVLRRRQTAMA